MFRNILSVIFVTFFLMSRVHAFDLVILDSRTEITRADTGKTETIGDSFDSITKFQSISKVLAPDAVSAYIPHNNPMGVLSFNLLVPERAKIRLEVDNGNTIYPRFDTDMIFTRRGETRYLSFNVTKPSVGNIYLYNQDSQLIKTIGYTVKKERPISQSVNVRVADPHLNNNDSNTSAENYSVNYSIQQRVSPGDPRWHMGATYSSDIGASELQAKDEAASLYFGYSW